MCVLDGMEKTNAGKGNRNMEYVLGERKGKLLFTYKKGSQELIKGKGYTK